MMRKLLFSVSLLSILSILLWNCSSDKDKMPDMGKNKKNVKYVELDFSMGIAPISNIRSLTDVQLKSFAVTANKNGGVNELNIDFTDDTWDNSKNKPKLYVCIGDGNNANLIEVESKSYNYYGGKEPKLHISEKFPYMVGGVKFHSVYI